MTRQRRTKRPYLQTSAAPERDRLTETEKQPVVFNSWGEYLEACQGESELEYGRQSRNVGQWFSKTASFEEALDLAVNGWPEGTEQSAKLAHPLIDKIAQQIARDEYRYETTGIAFDIARVLENEPECWIEAEPVQTEAPGKTLRLVLNGAVSAAIDTDTIVAKGAVTAALVSLLEQGGYRVQIDLNFTLRGNGHTFETWVPIKSADQDVDLSRLVFALGHPATLRRLYFAFAESRSAAVRSAHNVPSGYGYPDDCPVEKQGDIYIGRSSSYDPQWNDEASATEWILGKLREQGVTVSEVTDN